MFEISIIILSRLLLVAAGFLLYRKLYGWGDFDRGVLGRNGMTRLATPRTQQGYISLNVSAPKKVKYVKLNMGKRELRTPWGW